MSAVGFANGVLFRRDEAIARLRSCVSVKGKQTLRESPFDSEELFDSTVFTKALESSRQLAKDDQLLPNKKPSDTLKGKKKFHKTTLQSSVAASRLSCKGKGVGK